MRWPACSTVLLLALVACAAPPTASTPTPGLHDEPIPAAPGAPLPRAACDATPGQWALGRTATADVVERVRVDTHSRVVRVLHPGEIITMEFSAERANVRVDGDNAILAVTCG